jgi:hypothetical protein
MALFESSDGLIVTQEGSRVRALCGENNVLFRNRTPEVFLREYDDSVGRVRMTFQPRRSSDEWLTDEEFQRLTQKIALRWMYYYIVNGLELNLTQADMEHPQTKDIVWSFFCRKYGADSAKIPLAASKMLGITSKEFDSWLVGWKMFLNK